MERLAPFGRAHEWCLGVLLIVQYFSTLPKETSRPLNLTFNVRAWLWAASTMPIDAVIVHRSGQGKPWTQILHPGSWPHNLPAEYTMPEWATRLWRATLSDLLLATCSLNSTNYATGSMQRWSKP